MSKLVLIRGLPGSGKSTMARVLALIGFAHHEADHFFMVDGEYKFDASKLQEAHAKCLADAGESLSLGMNVVVSNTFTRMWEMKPYLDLAASLGCRVHVITADGSYQNVHGVPSDVIDRMRERWEAA